MLNATLQNDHLQNGTMNYNTLQNDAYKNNKPQVYFYQLEFAHGIKINPRS